MDHSTVQANLSLSTMWNAEESTSSDKPIILQIMFAVISLLAFGGNGVFCVVITRRRPLRRSPYHMLILTLAITDMMTGIFIVTTPGYIIELGSFPAPYGLGGELFCRLISTQYFVFVFGKVSVLTVVTLALERWYSIVKPISYKLNFSRNRIYLYITLIWLVSAITNGSKPIKAHLDESALRCAWSNITYPKEIFIPCYTTLTFFIPTAITWLSFFHVANVLKNSPAEENIRFRSTRKKLTRMCALVAFLLTMCWLPNQVFYTLSAFDITKAETPLHHFTIVLAMLNSCVNPWVCCLTNGDYKMAVRRLLCCGCKKRKSRQRNVFISTVMQEVEQTNSVRLNVLSFRYLNTGFTGFTGETEEQI